MTLTFIFVPILCFFYWKKGKTKRRIVYLSKFFICLLNQKLFSSNFWFGTSCLMCEWQTSLFMTNSKVWIFCVLFEITQRKFKNTGCALFCFFKIGFSIPLSLVCHSFRRKTKLFLQILGSQQHVQIVFLRRCKSYFWQMLQDFIRIFGFFNLIFLQKQTHSSKNKTLQPGS